MRVKVQNEDKFFELPDGAQKLVIHRNTATPKVGDVILCDVYQIENGEAVFLERKEITIDKEYLDILNGDPARQ